MSIAKFIATKWCDTFHGGGSIVRDNLGRLNWQCKKCGRYSDFPVSLEDEKMVIDRDIEAFKARRNRNIDIER